MSRIKSFVLVVFIAVWFLTQTRKALFLPFDDDDLMNMYRAWILPLPQLLIANITPFTSVYRPLGSALYRVEYLFAGLHPMPFHVVAFAFMMLNIWLIFRMAWLLTGSFEIASLCALIGCYHRRLRGIYVSNGTIYDILCFTFFSLAFCLYVATRQKCDRVSGLRLVLFCALNTLALNSKEMAVTLPVILLFYELIYARPHRWTLGTLYRWVLNRPAIWISAVITAAAIKAKTTPGGPFDGVADYTLNLSVQQFFKTTVPLINDLFLSSDGALGVMKVILVFALLWTVAVAMRDKALILAAVIISITPLPINFIAYRGFFVMYLPWLGWALYVAILLVAARDWIWSILPERFPRRAGMWKPERAGLFLVTALTVFTIQTRGPGWSFDQISADQRLISGLLEGLTRIRKPIPQNGRVLFVQDGFAAESWNPLYIIRLWYQDPSISIDRAKTMPPETGPVKLEEYNLVLDYRSERYEEVPPTRADLDLL